MSEFYKGDLYATTARFIEQPKDGPWICYLFGSRPGQWGALTMRPAEGCEPNWFRRKMQFLILGNLWVKDQ